MSDSRGLLCLPDESLLYILANLHYRDLVSVCKTCQRLRKLSADDFLWRWQCQHYFLDNVCTEGRAWQEHFIQLFREFGKYPDYIPIRKAWTKIEQALKDSCPRILASLQEGVSEAELDAIEDEIGEKLPLDLRASYRIHNGQDLDRHGPGLMGGGVISSHSRSDVLLPADTFADTYKDDSFMAGCCLLTLNSINISQVIAISDIGGFTPGAIYNPVHTDIDAFITGTSFKDWLCDHADMLEKNAYFIDREYIHRFYHDPSCVAVTNGIRVKPTSCFMPELSNPREPLYFFSYRIILEMDKDVPMSSSCRLMTRHWVITNGDGKEEHVDGPGVVGKHPVMKPGSQFDWISCTTFDTPEGSMGGYFRFCSLQTGDLIEVECPTFHMEALPVLKSEERMGRIMERALEQPSPDS